MNLFKMMQTGEGIEHLEEHLLNLDPPGDNHLQCP